MGRHKKEKIYAARVEFRKEEGRKIIRVYIHCNKRENTIKIDLEFPKYLDEKEFCWTGYYRRQERFKYSGPHNQVSLPMHPIGQKLDSLVSEAFSRI